MGEYSWRVGRRRDGALLTERILCSCLSVAVGNGVAWGMLVPLGRDAKLCELDKESERCHEEARSCVGLALSSLRSYAGSDHRRRGHSTQRELELIFFFINFIINQK